MNTTTRFGTAPRTRQLPAVVLAATALLVATLTVCQVPSAQAAPAAKRTLVGLFRLQAGTWSKGAHGSYFRMLQPDGRTYLTNTSSKAGDKSFTLLTAGTDGGLRTGAYQATPKPAFAKNGDALSGKVTAPTDFFGIKFATATNKKDPQTGHGTAVPTIYATGSTLSGNLSAFAASWNNQNFNQGSPKPNGTSPGFTRAVSGSFNTSTRAFTLTWRSLIVGGPFNKFTGEWHLTGTFVPTKAKTTTSASTPGTRTAVAPTRTKTLSVTSTPTTHAPTHSVTSTARTATATRARATRSARRSSSAAVAPGVTSRSATPSQAARTAAARIAARPVADSTSGSGTSGWLVGGGVAVVALLGLGAFWLVRVRSAQS